MQEKTYRNNVDVYRYTYISTNCCILKKLEIKTSFKLSRT